MAEVDYDAAARHERYLKTRHLKGREKGAGDAPSGGRPTAAPAPPKNNQAARAAAASKVKSLNAKLTSLRAALAKARAKSATQGHTSAAEKKSKDEKYNEEYYSKHKSEIAADKKKAERSAPSTGGSAKSATSTPAKPGTQSVADLEAAIKSTLTDLKAAVAKLRSL